jgi:hypothetical protein
VFGAKQGLIGGWYLFCRLLLLLLLLLLLVLVLVFHGLVLVLVLHGLVLGLPLLLLLFAQTAAVVVAAVAVAAVVDILEHHYCIPSCLYDYCIIAAPVRTGSTGPLPGIEYTEGVQGPFETVQDGTGYRVNKSEYRHRALHQKLTAAPTSSYSTLSNST